MRKRRWSSRTSGFPSAGIQDLDLVYETIGHSPSDHSIVGLASKCEEMAAYRTQAPHV